MSSTAPVTQPSAVSDEDSVASSLLRAIRDGQLPSPPAAQLLGLDLVDIRDGHVEFDFHPATRFDNGQAAVLGGVLAAVLHFAVSTAVLTALDIRWLPRTSTSHLSVRCIPTAAPCVASEFSFTEVTAPPLPMRP